MSTNPPPLLDLPPRERGDRLYTPYAAPVLAFLRVRVLRGVDALDVAQDVWRRVACSIDRLRHEEAPRAWVFLIARQTLAGWCGTPRPLELADDADLADPAGD